MPLVSWVSCPGLLLSPAHVHPQPPCWWGVGWGAEMPLALGKPCSAMVEASLCYQPCFQHKSKIQPHSSCCEEIEFYPRQNQHTHVQQAVKNMKWISKIDGLFCKGGKTWIRYSKLKTSANTVRQTSYIGLLKTNCTKYRSSGMKLVFFVFRIAISMTWMLNFSIFIWKLNSCSIFVSMKAVLEQHKSIKTDICSTAHISILKVC